MSTTDTTDDGRTRPASYMWTTPVNGQFRLELSWSDRDARWLQFIPDAEPYQKHSWKLLRCEVTLGDDGMFEEADIRTEVIVTKVLAEDVMDLLTAVQDHPDRYDRSPA